MTPATGAITGSLPRAEQGVASAMNDLSGELGGALGIAVLTSVMTSSYQHALHLPGQVPEAMRHVARNSLAAAVQMPARFILARARRSPDTVTSPAAIASARLRRPVARCAKAGAEAVRTTSGRSAGP